MERDREKKADKNRDDRIITTADGNNICQKYRSAIAFKSSTQHIAFKYNTSDNILHMAFVNM